MKNQPGNNEQNTQDTQYALEKINNNTDSDEKNKLTEEENSNNNQKANSNEEEINTERNPRQEDNNIFANLCSSTSKNKTIVD
ncbi:hypothetical protein [Candidatus Bandiella numerosa]|uniref:hypothetical protein n=1 Tax=Candidatus Bandiella numerosa TaxID=2570586 RepID=UPI001F3DE93E|nr:hypothetical protein [Candidatus Bandiella numerosa]